MADESDSFAYSCDIEHVLTQLQAAALIFGYGPPIGAIAELQFAGGIVQFSRVANDHAYVLDAVALQLEQQLPGAPAGEFFEFSPKHLLIDANSATISLLRNSRRTYEWICRSYWISGYR